MDAVVGPTEATQRDLAALMKLWSAPEAAVAASGERAAAYTAQPTVTACPPPAPAPLPPAGDGSPPSFGRREGWLTDFVAQPGSAALPPAAPRAVVAPAAPAPSTLRCLDATHDAACARRARARALSAPLDRARGS